MYARTSYIGSLSLTNFFVSQFQVETGSCFQRVFGNIQTALILKDISLEVRPGEVLAVLGSKGSGKRALLEVISRRSSGTTRGEIILDGTPMSPQLFQTTCGYVNHRTDLIPSLTVEQTLYYAAHLSIGPQVSVIVMNHHTYYETELRRVNLKLLLFLEETAEIKRLLGLILAERDKVIYLVFSSDLQWECVKEYSPYSSVWLMLLTSKLSFFAGFQIRSECQDSSGVGWSCSEQCSQKKHFWTHSKWT